MKDVNKNESLKDVISNVFSYYLDDSNSCKLHSIDNSLVEIIFNKPKFKGIESFKKYSNRLDIWCEKVKDIESTINQLKIIEKDLSITFNEFKENIIIKFIRKNNNAIYIKDGKNIIFIKENLYKEFNLPKKTKISLFDNSLKFKFENDEIMNEYSEIIDNYFTNLKIDNSSILIKTYPVSYSYSKNYIVLSLNYAFNYVLN